MAKLKMSWNMILDQKIFVYTKFVDHNIFEVIIRKGADASPTGPIWQSYTEHGLASKDEVVAKAFKKAEKVLKEELFDDVKKG